MGAESASGSGLPRQGLHIPAGTARAPGCGKLGGLEPRSLLGIVVLRVARRWKSGLSVPQHFRSAEARESGDAPSRDFPALCPVRLHPRGVHLCGVPEWTQHFWSAGRSFPGSAIDPHLEGPLCLGPRVLTGFPSPRGLSAYESSSLRAPSISPRCPFRGDRVLLRFCLHWPFPDRGPVLQERHFHRLLSVQRWLPKGLPQRFPSPGVSVSTAGLSSEESEVPLCSGPASGMLANWGAGRPSRLPYPGHGVPGDAQILSGICAPDFRSVTLPRPLPLIKDSPHGLARGCQLDSGVHPPISLW